MRPESVRGRRLAAPLADAGGATADRPGEILLPLHLEGEWPHLEATTDPSALAAELETVRAEDNGGSAILSACRSHPPLIQLS